MWSFLSGSSLSNYSIFERSRNTVARRYWRHLVLLGLVGVLRCLWITKKLPHPQPPRKSESCGVVPINMCLQLTRLCKIPVMQYPSTCYNICMLLQLCMQQQNHWKQTLVACCHIIINIIDMHRELVWNTPAAQPFLNTLLYKIVIPDVYEPTFGNIGDVIVLRTKACVCPKNSCCGTFVAEVGHVRPAAKEAKNPLQPLAQTRIQTNNDIFKTTCILENYKPFAKNLQSNGRAPVCKSRCPATHPPYPTHHWPTICPHPPFIHIKYPPAWQDCQNVPRKHKQRTHIEGRGYTMLQQPMQSCQTEQQKHHMHWGSSLTPIMTIHPTKQQDHTQRQLGHLGACSGPQNHDTWDRQHTTRTKWDHYCNLAKHWRSNWNIKMYVIAEFVSVIESKFVALRFGISTHYSRDNKRNHWGRTLERIHPLFRAYPELIPSLFPAYSELLPGALTTKQRENEAFFRAYSESIPNSFRIYFKPCCEDTFRQHFVEYLPDNRFREGRMCVWTHWSGTF